MVLAGINCAIGQLSIAALRGLVGASWGPYGGLMGAWAIGEHDSEEDEGGP